MPADCIQDGLEGDHAPVCVGARGAAPPEFCGGPTGYYRPLAREPLSCRLERIATATYSRHALKGFLGVKYNEILKIKCNATPIGPR
jgi:hypothetical protein